VYFAELLSELGSPAFRVETEVELLRRPARADVVIVRRRKRKRQKRSRGLRRLWSWIDEVALVEFKSKKNPLRRGDVAYWIALCLMFSAARRRRGELTAMQGVLAIVRRTPILLAEVQTLGATLRDEGGGYLTFEIGSMTAMVVVLDEVCRAERQPLLGLFSGSTLGEPRVARWLVDHFGKVVGTMGTKTTQTQKEVIEFLATHVPPKDLVDMITPERLLASIKPAQRLAGLDSEQIREALESLPASMRRAIAEPRPPRQSRPRRKGSVARKRKS
jgi:hypothetical protein